MPLFPGKENISRNIRELTEHGTRKRSHEQIVAIAMAESRRKKAGGGAIIPHISMADGGVAQTLARGSAPPFLRGGFIHSDVAGRTDRLPVRVLPGSHVIPADTISGLGQGNSNAGAKTLNDLIHAVTPQQKFAAGGAMEQPEEIIIAGGEAVIPPDVVRAIGGGDQKRGHDWLDKMILSVRKHTAKRLMELPGPKK